jgi:hypothetical protein
MDTNKKIIVFAPEQETLSYLSGELANRGYQVQWLPAESWQPDVFENASLVVLDLVDWEFENREYVQTLREYLANPQNRPFPVVMLVRPNTRYFCACGKMLQHRTNDFLDVDDLAAIGERPSNLIALLFDLTRASDREDWKKVEQILLLLAAHGIRIPCCDEALDALRRHDAELGHALRVNIVGGNLVGETI